MTQLTLGYKLAIKKQEGHEGPGSLTWENMNQMLNKANYITKIWPSELLFTLQVALEMNLVFFLAL